jgi:hypothetical protein
LNHRGALPQIGLTVIVIPVSEINQCQDESQCVSVDCPRAKEVETEIVLVAKEGRFGDSAFKTSICKRVNDDDVAESRIFKTLRRRGWSLRLPLERFWTLWWWRREGCHKSGVIVWRGEGGVRTFFLWSPSLLGCVHRVDEGGGSTRRRFWVWRSLGGGSRSLWQLSHTIPRKI